MKPKRDTKKRVADEAEAFNPPEEPLVKAEGKLPVAPEDDPQSRFALWSQINLTALERKVWRFLGKDHNPWGFKPQEVVGPYTLDFFSRTKMLCIEADGPTHINSVEEDERRDEYLAEQGILVLRLTAGDFVRNSPQKLYDLIEEMASVRHVLNVSKKGKR